MKSIKERLKDKRLREEKAELKKSSKVRTRQFRLPLFGQPYEITKGDTIYLTGKAKSLVDKMGPDFLMKVREQLLK